MALDQQQPIALTFEQYATKTLEAKADQLAWSTTEYNQQQGQRQAQAGQEREIARITALERQQVLAAKYA